MAIICGKRKSADQNEKFTKTLILKTQTVPNNCQLIMIHTCHTGDPHFSSHRDMRDRISAETLQLDCIKTVGGPMGEWVLNANLGKSVHTITAHSSWKAVSSLMRLHCQQRGTTKLNTHSCHLLFKNFSPDAGGCKSLQMSNILTTLSHCHSQRPVQWSKNLRGLQKQKTVNTFTHSYMTFKYTVGLQ